MTDPTPNQLGEAARLLCELADLAYFEVDGERNVVAMSPAMERLTGFRAADVLGRSCLTVHRCQECLAGCGVFDQGTVRDKHLELYRADGSTVHVSKSGQVFRDPEGRIVGALEIVRPRPQPESPAAESAEAQRIRRALEEAGQHRSRAAKALGISRTTLWRRMREFGL